MWPLVSILFALYVSTCTYVSYIYILEKREISVLERERDLFGLHPSSSRSESLSDGWRWSLSSERGKNGSTLLAPLNDVVLEETYFPGTFPWGNRRLLNPWPPLHWRRDLTSGSWALELTLRANYGVSFVLTFFFQNWPFLQETALNPYQMHLLWIMTTSYTDLYMDMYPGRIQEILLLSVKPSLATGSCMQYHLHILAYLI